MSQRSPLTPNRLVLMVALAFAASLAVVSLMAFQVIVRQQAMADHALLQLGDESALLCPEGGAALQERLDGSAQQLRQGSRHGQIMLLAVTILSLIMNILLGVLLARRLTVAPGGPGASGLPGGRG